MADRILHLEDTASDAYLIGAALRQAGIECEITVVSAADEFRDRLAAGDYLLVLCDSGVPGLSAREALEIVRRQRPLVQFLCVTGEMRADAVSEMIAAGASEYVSKGDQARLVTAVRRCLERARRETTRLENGARAAMQLVATVQKLSLARDLAAVQAIVRSAVRELTGADGATIVLRDGDHCHYVDEDAIGPLWKGQRFPMTTCISGWVMLNAEPAVIADIYADRRIPAAAYRTTFVKSVAMVPIRSAAPIGAIGAYWARRHSATREELELLQALADTAAVAMENIEVYADLERRVNARTAELETARDRLEVANAGLESFSYSASHDLRAPLRALNGFAALLAQALDDGRVDDVRDLSSRLQQETIRLQRLIDGLLDLARVSRTDIRTQRVDLSGLARAIVARLATEFPGRVVETEIEDGLGADADPGLAQVVLENLLSNAWKYTSKADSARVAFRSEVQGEGRPPVFLVRDNGVGFDMGAAGRLFQPFQRLHPQRDYPGSGIGLATVRRIVEAHGGRVWAESRPGAGTTVRFTLRRDGSPPETAH